MAKPSFAQTEQPPVNPNPTPDSDIQLVELIPAKEATFQRQSPAQSVTVLLEGRALVRAIGVDQYAYGELGIYKAISTSGNNTTWTGIGIEIPVDAKTVQATSPFSPTSTMTLMKSERHVPLPMDRYMVSYQVATFPVTNTENGPPVKALIEQNKFTVTGEPLSEEDM